jgi:hypothetical protein
MRHRLGPCPFSPKQARADGGAFCDGSGFLVDEETQSTSDCRCRRLRVVVARQRGLGAVPRYWRHAASSLHRLPEAEIHPATYERVRRYLLNIDRALDDGESLWLLDPEPRIRRFESDETTVPVDVELSDVRTEKPQRALPAPSVEGAEPEGGWTQRAFPDYATALAMVIAETTYLRRTRIVVTLNQLIGRLGHDAAQSTNAFERTWSALREADLVVLWGLTFRGWETKDDAQRAWARDQIFLLLNDRYDERCSTVVATRGWPLDSLRAELGKAVFDRLFKACGDPLPTARSFMGEYP